MLTNRGGTNLSITLPDWVGWGWRHPRTRLTNVETDSLLLPIIAPPLGGPRTRLTNIEAGSNKLAQSKGEAKRNKAKQNITEHRNRKERNKTN